ncbi:unnamed protein product (macronuclear) [Paramecium tetraurelia]|uniref:ER membrane protein complex subunit 6 n=1 Tax=Paramecium tetraurelia TaxID=5888 RepID=A0CBX9_PARTE|nr:uncharacterized protein GSPATT00037079001 [Paramecium tetraurelia]CAK68296.1 unnamed protein product [Paramecium tetraurelia]|eukprot:XP_001435693.1 hypothetical protein (macronuclear) [Paramecium tetraurelia strain d4-2]
MEEPKVELDDLEVNQERLKQNTNQLKNLRVYGSLNAGMIAGILGMDGWIGMGIYVVVFLIVSACLAIKMNFRVKEYFKSSYDAYYSGIGTDLLLFLMIWVIFHNIVNIL